MSDAYMDSGDFNVKIPPNDVEAEQAILGSMFFGVEAINTAHESLKSEDFYRGDNRAIFEAMIELYLKNIPVDLVTLKDKISEKGLLEQVGNMEYLIYLASSVSTSANLEHYINIVEKKSILRKLIDASNTIAKESYEGSKEIDEILEIAEKSVFEIVQDRDTGDFHHIHDILIDSIDEIEEIYKNKGTVSGIPSGFIDIDNKTAGFHPSDLILVGARPSMGKTAFALSITQNVAVKRDYSVAFFSLEMSKSQMITRLLCAEAMVDSQKLRTGELDSTDWEKIADAIPTLSKSSIYLDDTPGITTNEVRAKCRRLKMEKGLDLIIIDYLQLMTGNKKTESRQQEISEISRNLKGIAREMEAPVIALSQLSRAVESRNDKRPMLSDLRESGAIEQDADVVAFLYRDDYYNPDSEKKGEAEIIIAKQRNGPTGSVDLMYLGAYTKFVNKHQ